MIRLSVCSYRMQHEESVKAEPKGMQINYVYIFFTDSTSMFRRGDVNPSLLELIFKTMDRVSYWRQILYHRNSVQSTLLGIMKHIQLASVNLER